MILRVLGTILVILGCTVAAAVFMYDYKERRCDSAISRKAKTGEKDLFYLSKSELKNRDGIEVIDYYCSSNVKFCDYEKSSFVLVDFNDEFLVIFQFSSTPNIGPINRQCHFRRLDF